MKMNASKERKRGAPTERIVGGDALSGKGDGAGASSARTVAPLRERT